LGDSGIIAYPRFGEEIWLFSFITAKIFSVQQGTFLSRIEDDRGLYQRIGEIFPVDLRITLSAQGVECIIFTCPPNVGFFSNTSWANTVMIYDGLEESRFVDPYIFRAKLFTYLDRKWGSNIVQPTFCMIDKIDSLYLEDSITDTEKGHLGIVARPDNHNLLYLLEDPYANLHEPKYLNKLEITQISPPLEYLDDLLDNILSNMNWEIIKTKLPTAEDGGCNWLASIVMDNFYFDGLYYIVAKRLWLEERKTVEALQGVDEEHLIINFSEIKNKIRTSVMRKLKAEKVIDDKLKISDNAVSGKKIINVPKPETKKINVEWVFK